VHYLDVHCGWQILSLDTAHTLFHGQAGPAGMQKKLLRAEGLQEYIPAEIMGVYSCFICQICRPPFNFIALVEPS
jgi:hypothetical protein